MLAPLRFARGPRVSTQLATILSFTLCAALLTITPGADTLLVLTHGLRAGRRPALACAFGVNVGLICWATLTVAGLSALLASSPWAYRCLQVAGALYLVRLGVVGLTRGRRDPAAIEAATAGEVPGGPWTGAFRRGLVTNLLNPKVGVFYVSLLPQFAPPDERGPTLLLALAAIHLTLSVGWLGAIGWASARASRSLSPTVARRLEATGAVALLGAGAVLAGASL